MLFYPVLLSEDTFVFGNHHRWILLSVSTSRYASQVSNYRFSDSASYGQSQMSTYCATDSNVSASCQLGFWLATAFQLKFELRSYLCPLGVTLLALLQRFPNVSVSKHLFLSSCFLHRVQCILPFLFFSVYDRLCSFSTLSVWVMICIKHARPHSQVST